MITIVLMRFTAGLYLAFVMSRFNKSLYGPVKYGRVSSLLYLLPAVAFTILSSLLQTPIPGLVTGIVFFFTASLCYETTIKKALLSTSVFVLTGIVFFFLSSFLVYPYYPNESYYLMSACISALLTGLSEFIFELLKKKCDEKEPGMPYFAVVMLVPLMSVITLLTLNTANSPNMLVQLSLSTFLLWINLFTLFLYFNLIETMNSEREGFFYKIKAEEYSNQLDLEMQSQEQVRSFRHDMQNHLSELMILVKADAKEKALAYIEEMTGVLKNPKEYSKCGNRELDGMLNYLLRNAEKLGIDVIVSGAAPERIFVSEYELNVIIGNLVDNAMDAAAESAEKRIEINILFDKDLLHFSIKNSYCGELRRDKTGQLQSSKLSPEEHGLGIKNVIRTVKKNGGTITFESDDENKLFYADVMLYAGDTERFPNRSRQGTE